MGLSKLISWEMLKVFSLKWSSYRQRQLFTLLISFCTVFTLVVEKFSAITWLPAIRESFLIFFLSFSVYAKIFSLCSFASSATFPSFDLIEKYLSTVTFSLLFYFLWEQARKCRKLFLSWKSACLIESLRLFYSAFGRSKCN
jgi:hypothetical protein